MAGGGAVAADTAIAHNHPALEAGSKCRLQHANAPLSTLSCE